MTDFLVSYSTKGYYERHERMNLSAKMYGLENIFSFYDYDLKNTDFYQENRYLLDNKRGAGFWIWKPYYIREALNHIEEDDFLMYVDAASLFISDPAPLIKIGHSNGSGIVAFDAWPLNNGQWTKRDTFINLGSDEERFWTSNHIIATVIAFRKCDSVVRFVDEWLQHCLNVQSISDLPNIHGKENLPVYIDHRMDQSILSILVEKYQIETYRNPSKWGNFLKLDQYRVEGEYVGYPYAIMDTISDYSTTPYKNSPYGTIFEFNLKESEDLITKPALRFHEKILNKLSSFGRTKI